MKKIKQDAIKAINEMTNVFEEYLKNEKEILAKYSKKATKKQG